MSSLPKWSWACLDGGEVGLAIGDVQLDRKQRVAVFLDEVGKRRGVAGGACDLVAALEGRDRPFPAEAT